MGDATVGWIAAIIIGGIAGWLAEQFMKSDMGLLMNIVLGIVGAACQRYFEFLWDRPRGMARLPHCWLHRRVLADLGRPLDTGISSDSLRAAIRQARTQVKPPLSIFGLPVRVRLPARVFAIADQLKSLALRSLSIVQVQTLRACLDEIRTSHHPRSSCPWRDAVRPTR
jgi:hypothetical protein